MADGQHCFISYSGADGLAFATRLADELQGQHPFFKIWFDKRELSSASPEDWDDQLANAIKACKCLIFVMTEDSTAEGSVCKNEWTWALKYKKPLIIIRKDKKAEAPFRLSNRQHIDFVTTYDVGIAQLRTALARLDSPEGALDQLNQRLADANRDLRRAKGDEENRIKGELEELKKQIETQQRIVDNPQAAQEQTQKNIEAGLERERKPEKPTTARTSTKFINPPPGIAPNWFQDRMVETKQIVDFLNEDAQRLMTIVGRGGVGKTAMVCRLLKGLEGGELPDGLGKMRVEGIVYLSESGSHRVNFANLFYDLCKLLPSDAAQELDAVYKNPQGSTESKMRALLEKFGGPQGRVVALLDNFEPLVDTETFAIRDAELDEALRAFLNGTHSAVKVVITTRVAPRALNLIQPGRQRGLTLDEGLESPYAENILREMDSDGRLVLKSAGAEALNRARIKTRGFPRALEALFAILASDRYTTLEELLAMPLPENVVEALVGEAFNRLDTNAQKVMQALAVYNRPVTPAAVDYLLAPHLPAMDSAPILQRLANMHFARKESGRFYLHPVDREFAFGLIPVEDLTTKDTKVTKEEIKAEKPSKDVDDILAELRRLQGKTLQPRRSNAFTQHDLTSRAADYFARARKPRTEWKKLEDLSAQLAEFDLRCTAGDYDAAASILLEYDFEYLLLWGHYRLAIDMHEKLRGKINDKDLERKSIGNLGTAYSHIGNIQISIEYTRQALEMSRNTKNRMAEGTWLGNLGNRYASLGEIGRAIESYELSLSIANSINNRNSQENNLICLGSMHSNLGEYDKAIEFYEQAISIIEEIGDQKNRAYTLNALGDTYFDLGKTDFSIKYFKEAIEVSDKISLSIIQSSSRSGLAQVYLLYGDLVNSNTLIESSLQYDVPQNNHNASALHGIIALRQGDEVTARGAFVRAIGQADEILSKTAEYYDALDAKGLALCGLAICDLRLGRGAVPVPNDTSTNDTGRGDPAPTVNDAIETFRKARKIAPHAGVVKRVLRLFDELVKCDTEGVLKEVRNAVEGKE